MTKKFFGSLLSSSHNKLSTINCSILARGNLHVGINNEPLKKLDLLHVSKAIALVGDIRSGKTTYLSDYVLNDLYPWWYRCFFPPRGLFLKGSQTAYSPTIDAWLTKQLRIDKDNNPWSKLNDPWAALEDLLSERYDEQSCKYFLHAIFKNNTPSLLKPQPVVIVLDDAEELLRAYRGNFLKGFFDLVKKAKETDLCRLVLVVKTEQAVNALQLLNEDNLLTFIQAPKVSREAVVKAYGEEFAKIFDECDRCIGIALDYVSSNDRLKYRTPREFCAVRKGRYIEENCLVAEITREEYRKSWPGEHHYK